MDKDTTGVTLKAQGFMGSSTQVLAPPTFTVPLAPVMAEEAEEELTPQWSDLHTGISTNPSYSEVPEEGKIQEEEVVSFGSMSQTLFKLTERLQLMGSQEGIPKVEGVVEGVFGCTAIG